MSTVIISKTPGLVQFGNSNNQEKKVSAPSENSKSTVSSEPSTGTKIGGAFLGLATNGIFSRIMLAPISIKCMSAVKKLGSNLTDAEYTAIKDAAGKAIKETGLAKKGVEIVIASSKNADEIKKIVSNEVDKNLLTKHLPKFLKQKIVEGNSRMLTSGGNACYTFASKKLIMPQGKKLSWAVFHEMGHAMNANFSKIGKFLQICRPACAVVVPVVLFTSLFKNKKPDGVKPEGALDKTTTFIKNNAGKLAFLSFLPMLIEEGMASIKGGNLAKKLLNPELAKKVSKGNKIAYLTYLGMAVASGIGVYLANKVRDAVVASKKAA